MIDKYDIKVETLSKRFVRVTHLPTGIVVTKYGKYSIRTMEEAMEELEMLVAIWEEERMM